MSETKSKEKEGWYPGKLIQKRKSAVFGSKEDKIPEFNVAKSSSVSSTPESHKLNAPEVNDGKEKPVAIPSSSKTDDDTQSVQSYDSDVRSSSSTTSSKAKEGWYPGKFIGRKNPRESRTSATFIRNKLPLAGKPPVKSVGNAIVKMLGVKYMSATRPSFEVWLDRQVETFQLMGLEQDGSSTEEFEGFYSLGDLSTDIVILVKEEYNVGNKSMENEEENIIGRVVIPITSYLTLKGRAAPKKEWMAVYPLANPKNPMEMYQGGLNELPGSGMPKSKQSLGFLCVQIELLLPEGPVYYQYLEGEPPRPLERILSSPDEMVDETDSERHVKTKSKNFDPEKFYRICLRLRQYFCTAPAALAPVLIFPEVLVLIALYGFLCFGASASQIPLIFFLLVALNGILTSKACKVVFWNEMLDHSPNAVLTDPHTGKALPLAMKKSPEYVYQHLQEHLFDCQEFLEKTVNILEVLSNIWNFSDLRASVVFYGFWGIYTLFATLVIIIFSARMLFFITGATLLLLNSLRDIFPELFSLDKLFEMLTSEEHEYKFQAVRNVFTKFWLAISRVPTQKIMVHRHIARSCIVDDEGDLMKDAAIKLKNM